MTDELTSKEFDQATKDGLVIVDLWAPWCGPCRMLAPVIDELAKEYEGKARFCKLNIDEHQEPAVQHQVMSIPTLLIFKDGKVVDRIVGALPKDKITQKIQEHL
jgi:thioredoxin 1